MKNSLYTGRLRWMRRDETQGRKRRWRNKNIFEKSWKYEKFVVYCKASLIAAKSLRNERFIKKLQPISVGVWWRLPSSSELSLNWLTNAHENRSEVHFNSVFMSCSKERKNSRSNYRVWSWLRLNAGGMLYTCKSNGSTDFGLVASGERVSNTSERAQSWGIT